MYSISSKYAHSEHLHNIKTLSVLSVFRIHRFHCKDNRLFLCSPTLTAGILETISAGGREGTAASPAAPRAGQWHHAQLIDNWLLLWSTISAGSHEQWGQGGAAPLGGEEGGGGDD